MIDVRCDETDDDQSRGIEVVASEAWKRGLYNKVVASHTCAMGSCSNAYVFKLMSIIQSANMHFGASLHPFLAFPDVSTFYEPFIQELSRHAVHFCTAYFFCQEKK